MRTKKQSIGTSKQILETMIRVFKTIPVSELNKYLFNKLSSAEDWLNKYLKVGQRLVSGLYFVMKWNMVWYDNIWQSKVCYGLVVIPKFKLFAR